MQEVIDDRARYGRLNQEQKEELGRRLEATSERLPDHVVMAFRHLLMLASGGQSGLQLDHIDLGPSTVNGRIDQRVVDHLVAADKLVVEQLAPAALLTERFGVFPPHAEALSLEDLRGYFGRHPHLPKLASAAVLRDCVVKGVREGVFGLALGAQWNSQDSVLRIDASVASDEVPIGPSMRHRQGRRLRPYGLRRDQHHLGPLRPRRRTRRSRP